MSIIKNRFVPIIGLFTTIFFLVSCETEILTDLGATAIIPQPTKVVATGGSFDMTSQTSIYYKDEFVHEANYLATLLSKSTGFVFKTQSTTDKPSSGNIYLTDEPTNEEMGSEGYMLTISDELVTISANEPAGIFYGIQTLRQILPAKIEKQDKQEGPWSLATGTISDNPEYDYRGSMLDVARHFFEVEDIKRYIDLIAAYKLNVLHLHLSDDQGWRIEIKSWPNLAEHGGKTEVGGGEGGYYTQVQYQDIVAYATNRHIMIIPEIDMPSHTNAALASYAELNCNGKARELYSGTEVGFTTLCTNKEVTYKFVNDVVEELSALTPGPFIHIGGDESHVTPMEDYIPFIERVQEIVQSHGKIMIGWDEVAHAKIDSSTIIQFWARADNATMGVKQSAKVIMSPASKAYLDMKYDTSTVLGLHWAGYVPVDIAYSWDPATLVPEISRQDILGIEAPLWSETVTNIEDIEYMLFPRIPGYAEIGWSSGYDKSWEEYKTRLGKQGPRLEAMGINYFKSKRVPWVSQ